MANRDKNRQATTDTDSQIRGSNPEYKRAIPTYRPDPQATILEKYMQATQGRFHSAPLEPIMSQPTSWRDTTMFEPRGATTAPQSVTLSSMQ